MTQYDSVTTRTAGSSTRPKPTTEGLPLWKSYEPNTPAWFKQARKRYPNHIRKLDELAELVEENPLVCFECYETSDLADYFVRGQKSEIFRYCRVCARAVRKNGTAITKIQDIADAESPAEEEWHNPKETIELPLVKESRSPARKNFHPLFYVGSTVFSCVLLFVFITSGLPFISAQWNAAHNGSPPISELSIMVAGKPYEAIAQNLNGQVIVIIEPLGDIGHMHAYPIARTSEPSAVPTMSFDGNSVLYIHLDSDIFPLNLGK